MAPILSFLAFGLLAASPALGHPGHDAHEEAAERGAFLKRSPKSVRSCASQLERRGHQYTSISR